MSVDSTQKPETEFGVSVEGLENDLNEKQKSIYRYLCKTLDEGNEYYKSREIGEVVGLSDRVVAANMHQIQKHSDAALHIEQWSTTSPVTWLVKRPEK